MVLKDEKRDFEMELFGFYKLKLSKSFPFSSNKKMLIISKLNIILTRVLVFNPVPY